MRGLPDHFGTPQDIAHCMSIDPVGAKAMLQRLLDGRMTWAPVAELTERDAGKNDAMFEVRVEPVDRNADLSTTGRDAQLKRVQYELQEDPLTPLFRLGLTTASVTAMIAECDRLVTSTTRR